MPNKVSADRKPALRRHAATLVQYMPDDPAEWLFVLRELKLQMHYVQGGPNAARKALRAGDAAEVVNMAGGPRLVSS